MMMIILWEGGELFHSLDDVIKCLFMHLAQNDLYLVQRVFNFD